MLQKITECIKLGIVLIGDILPVCYHLIYNLLVVLEPIQELRSEIIWCKDFIFRVVLCLFV